MRKQMHLSRPKAVKIKGKTQQMAQVIETRGSGDTVDLYIYDQIQGDSEDWWTGETVQSETSADFIRQTLDSAPEAKQINLFVNSVGGDVMEAMGIRAHLLRHQATKTAYVDGWACSAATFLLTACDTVYMIPGSMQFIHDMWTIAIGNAHELRQIADDLDRQQASNREIYMERIGDKLTEDKLTEMMAAETWLSAAESVELGLADEVLASDDYRQVLSERTQRGSVPSAVTEQSIRMEVQAQARDEPEGMPDTVPDDTHLQQAVEPDEDITTDVKESVNYLADFLVAIKAKEETQ